MMTREEFLESIRPLCFPSFVYVSSVEEFIKIGLSKNPKRRMKELSKAFGEPFHLIVAAPGAKWNETDLHHEWRDFAVGREFFRFPPLELKILIASMSSRRGAIIA